MQPESFGKGVLGLRALMQEFTGGSADGSVRGGVTLWTRGRCYEAGSAFGRRVAMHASLTSVTSNVNYMFAKRG